MKVESDKPENFSVVIRSGVAHVERNLEFGLDRVQFSVGIAGAHNMSITDLHKKSLQTAIDHLQVLLSKSGTAQA